MLMDWKKNSNLGKSHIDWPVLHILTMMIAITDGKMRQKMKGKMKQTWWDKEVRWISSYPSTCLSKGRWEFMCKLGFTEVTALHQIWTES